MPEQGSVPDLDAEVNPRITTGLRVAMAVAVVVVLGGSILLFLPARVTRWYGPSGRSTPASWAPSTWPNGRRAGARGGGSSPSRPGRDPGGLTFTGVVFLASLVLVGDFDFERRVTWLWFLADGGFTALLPFYLPGMRRGPVPPLTSPGWRRWFLVEGVLLCAYGAGPLVAPEPLTEFWPWTIDAFHGRIYSAVFLTFGVGSLLLVQRSAAIELRAIGASRLVLGAFALLGLVLADDRVGTVDWAATGTVVWTAGFAAMAVVGAAMLASARRPTSV